ncbi:histidine phosphatase family protein [Lewinellaceae bacterium SD302]|nr:histidine phosphatase family protein [Lewinellaceae bacterium SD302]
MAKKIYIIRHGETDFNRLGIVQGSGVDSSLNEVGREQGRLFYEKYQDVPFELVVTSKLKRTAETVRRFIDEGIPTVSFAEINEMSWGEHEGKKGTADSIAEYQRIKDGWGRGEIDGRIGGGESAREMGARLQVFIEQLRAMPEQTILVCSHGRAMCGLVTLMMGKPIDLMNSFRHSNTGLWLAEQADDNFVFHLENDRSHLAEMLNESTL